MKRDNVISKIEVGPSLLIAVVSVVFGLLINSYVKDDLGRSSFFSSLVILLSIYSCRNHIHETRILLYIIFYAVVHIVFSVAFGSSLEHVPGPVIMTAAIVDYTLFYCGAQFVSKHYGDAA